MLKRYLKYKPDYWLLFNSIGFLEQIGRHLISPMKEVEFFICNCSQWQFFKIWISIRTSVRKSDGCESGNKSITVHTELDMSDDWFMIIHNLNYLYTYVYVFWIENKTIKLVVHTCSFFFYAYVKYYDQKWRSLFSVIMVSNLTITVRHIISKLVSWPLK